jgi:hypothetical protein
MSDDPLNDDARQSFIDDLAELFQSVGASVTVSQEGVHADFTKSMPDNLPMGASHYDGVNTVYYRGDGVNDTVVLPEGKAAQSVKPRRRYRSHPKNWQVVTFNPVIPSGELVTITLRDSE